MSDISRINGLWSLQFFANEGTYGGGVAVFKDGKLYGGDSEYYYLGDYTIEGRRFHLKVDVIYYSGQRRNLLGDDDVTSMEFFGEIEEGSFNVSGALNKDESRQLRVRFIKRSDI